MNERKQRMKIHIDIRDDIPPAIALYYVCKVVAQGRISNNNKSYCYSTLFKTSVGNIFISNVHELQHALRLCGINKEIEI